MAAGGKTPDANAFWINSPLHGARAHGADRSLHVEHGGGLMIARCEAVLEHKRLDSVFVEPFCYLFAFVVHRQVSVAATRTNHHRGTVGFIRGRRIDRERGLIGRLFANRSRGAVGPEQNRFHAIGRLAY